MTVERFFAPEFQAAYQVNFARPSLPILGSIESMGSTEKNSLSLDYRIHNEQLSWAD
jgi:hypothetical protein